MKFKKVIPASNGYFILAACSEMNGYPCEIWTRSIIAWGFADDDMIAVPISLEGTHDSAIFSVAILRPDGSVEVPDVTYFNSADEWLLAEQVSFNEKKLAAA